MAGLGPWWRQQHRVQYKSNRVCSIYILIHSFFLMILRQAVVAETEFQYFRNNLKQHNWEERKGRTVTISKLKTKHPSINGAWMKCAKLGSMKIKKNLLYLCSIYIQIFALVFFSWCWGTPSMWTFHGKYCSDFSLEDGSRRGRERRIGMNRRRRKEKTNRTTAKEIRALNHTRFCRCWWVFYLPPPN